MISGRENHKAGRLCPSFYSKGVYALKISYPNGHERKEGDSNVFYYLDLIQIVYFKRVKARVPLWASGILVKSTLVADTHSFRIFTQ